jgi:lipopolysaccharide biosynthesis protein
MNSICFFCSYFNESKIPYYIRIYIEELSRHFSKVVFLTNEKQLAGEELKYLESLKIESRFYKNEGFDFGMWKKAFNDFPVLEFDRVGLVNDSCILFKKMDFIFDWIEKGNYDFCGMTDSNALSYHLQSYFLVLNKNAIHHTKDYLEKNGTLTDIRDVIKTYEVGLSSYLIERGLKAGAYFSRRDYFGEFSPALYFVKELIKEGMPLIKKKIIYASFRKEENLTLMRMDFKMDPMYYVGLIEESNKGTLLIDFKKITAAINRKNKYDWKWKIGSALYRFARKLKFI